MPDDPTDAIDVRAPFEGGFVIPEHELTRRWFDGVDVTPELTAQILDVLEEAFNHDVSWYALPVSPEDHFNWKYRDSPLGVTLSITVEPSGRVIGFIGGLRRVWYLQGKPHVARAGYDLSRRPEWQGRGLQRAFQRFRGEGWHPSEGFLFEYITHPADRAMAIARGERAPANETHDYVRLLRLEPLRRARDLVSRARRAVARGEAEAPRSSTSRVLRERARTKVDRVRESGRRIGRSVGALLARRPAPDADGVAIVTLERFAAHHEPFIDEALSQFDFVPDRSIDYLNWRYLDQRAGPFTVRVAERDGELLGYAVTRVYRGAAYLADILARPDELLAAELLIRDSIALAREGGAAFINTRLSKRHPYGPALRRAGFADIGNHAGELISARHTPEEELAFLDWHGALIHHVLADSDFI